MSIVDPKGQVHELFYARLKRGEIAHAVSQSQVLHGISLANICTNQVFICTYLLEIFHDKADTTLLLSTI